MLFLFNLWNQLRSGPESVYDGIGRVACRSDNTEKGAKSFGFSLVGCRGGAIFFIGEGDWWLCSTTNGWWTEQFNVIRDSKFKNGMARLKVGCAIFYSLLSIDLKQTRSRILARLTPKITASKENLRKEQTRKLSLPFGKGLRIVLGNLLTNDENEEWTNFYATVTVKCIWCKRIHREEQRSLRLTLIGNVKTPSEKSRIIFGKQIHR